jgi:hypothetical protein
MLVNVLHLLPGADKVSRGYCGSLSLPCMLVLNVFEHICDCNWYENLFVLCLLYRVRNLFFLLSVSIFVKS